MNHPTAVQSAASFQAARNVVLWLHLLRSFFHVFCLMTGLIYSFAQPRFLNVEVWTWIYSLAGLALALDALVFINYNKWKSWNLVYAADAFFIFLMIYKTGYVFFPFLFLFWLFQVMSAGLQFSFRGALFQGIWISFLFTWLILISPHFSEWSYSEGSNIWFFILNHLALFAAVALGGFAGHCFKGVDVFHRVSDFFKSLVRPDEDLNLGVQFKKECGQTLARIQKTLKSKTKEKDWLKDLQEDVDHLDQKIKNWPVLIKDN